MERCEPAGPVQGLLAVGLGCSVFKGMEGHVVPGEVALWEVGSRQSGMSSRLSVPHGIWE